MHVVLPHELQGCTAHLEVVPSHTVADVVQMAMREADANRLLRLAGGQPRLFAADIPHDLSPDTRIGDLRLRDQHVLRLLMPGAPRPELSKTRQISIQTLTGKTITIDVSLDAVVLELKALVWAKEGVCVCV